MKKILGFSCNILVATTFLLLTPITCNAKRDIFLQPFNVTDDDIQTILNHTVCVPSAASLPADFSFLAADIKYKDGVVKFCELGDGIYMAHLRDVHIEINQKLKTINSPPWIVVWHYLKQCGLPFWLIGPEGCKKSKMLWMNKHLLAIDALKKSGGEYLSGLDSLEKSDKFRQAIKKDFNNPYSFKNHRGIIFYCAEAGEHNTPKIQEFKRRYPGFIIVNEALSHLVSRKDSTYKLFHDTGLTDYIPHTKFYTRTSCHTLAHNILQDFSSEYLIIKPIASSSSKGVIMTPKDRLDSFLSLILNADKKTLQKNKVPWLSEWAYENNSKFMVSEYVPSKVITRSGKPYDPTMRLMIMLQHDQGSVYVTVIGGYWKIPGKSLIDQAALTEKHITRSQLTMYGQDPLYRGILIEKEDMDSVRAILNSCLPVLYTKILTDNCAHKCIK